MVHADDVQVLLSRNSTEIKSSRVFIVIHRIWFLRKNIFVVQDTHEDFLTVLRSQVQ